MITPPARCATLEDTATAPYGLGMSRGTAFGEYLRARRDLLRPEDVGLAGGGRRRVPGLRREELAMLAGISPNYYLRLEQGRDRHPSRQVVEALARALRLDEDTAAFLYSLSDRGPSRQRDQRRERAPASIERLIDSWPNTPAFVHSRYLDVLAANRLWIALCPILGPGANLLRAAFLDPELPRLYSDWDAVAQGAVARARSLVAGDVDDPRFGELIRELSERSEEFRRLWARYDIELSAARPHVYNHPIVGRIQLRVERLEVVGTDGQVLIARHAEPGSPSERALQRLARLAVDHTREPVPDGGRETGGLANSG